MYGGFDFAQAFLAMTLDWVALGQVTTLQLGHAPCSLSCPCSLTHLGNITKHAVPHLLDLEQHASPPRARRLKALGSAIVLRENHQSAYQLIQSPSTSLESANVTVNAVQNLISLYLQQGGVAGFGHACRCSGPVQAVCGADPL